MYVQPQDVQSTSEDEEPENSRPPCLGAQSTAPPATSGATAPDGEAEVRPEPEQKPEMEAASATEATLAAPGAGGKANRKNKRKGGGPARDEVDDMSVRELRAALAKFSVAIPRRASR